MNDKYERALQTITDLLLDKLDDKGSLILEREPDWGVMECLNKEIEALIVVKHILVEEVFIP